MSLYWPEFGIALELTDDEGSERFDRQAHPEVRVLSMSVAELEDEEAFDEVAREVAESLGVDAPEPTAKWVEAHRNLRRALFRADLG